MRGKVKFAKFPKGLYYCQIEDVKAGVDSKGEELIVVHYRIQDGPRKGETFKERLRSVSFQFLKGLGEPHEYNADWDTEHWRNKFVWVDVKYSEDEAAWPRYGHHQIPPLQEPEPPEAPSQPVTTAAGEEIPF